MFLWSTTDSQTCEKAQNKTLLIDPEQKILFLNLFVVKWSDSFFKNTYILHA